MIKNILSKDSREIIVMSVGGSIVAPKEIDTKYVKKLITLLENHTDKYRFILIIGGGKTAREYIKALEQINPHIENKKKDWLGIYATKLNAMLVKNSIQKSVYKKIIDTPHKKVRFNQDFLVGGGYLPGVSSDYSAVSIAKTYQINKIINLTNVDYVYDKNPKEHKDAKPIKKLEWNKFFEMFGENFEPGANYPFDPIAAKKSQKFNKIVIIANGLDLDNLELILKNKKYKGTEIKN